MRGGTDFGMRSLIDSQLAAPHHEVTARPRTGVLTRRSRSMPSSISTVLASSSMRVWFEAAHAASSAFGRFFAATTAGECNADSQPDEGFGSHRSISGAGS